MKRLIKIVLALGVVAAGVFAYYYLNKEEEKNEYNEIIKPYEEIGYEFVNFAEIDVTGELTTIYTVDYESSESVSTKDCLTEGGFDFYLEEGQLVAEGTEKFYLPIEEVKSIKEYSTNLCACESTRIAVLLQTGETYIINPYINMNGTETERIESIVNAYTPLEYSEPILELGTLEEDKVFSDCIGELLVIKTETGEFAHQENEFIKIEDIQNYYFLLASKSNMIKNLIVKNNREVLITETLEPIGTNLISESKSILFAAAFGKNGYNYKSSYTKDLGQSYMVDTNGYLYELFKVIPEDKSNVMRDSKYKVVKIGYKQDPDGKYEYIFILTNKEIVKVSF